MEKESKIGFGIESFNFNLGFSGPRKLLDSIMHSDIVRLLGGLVCLLLAFVFFSMFFIGSVGLLKNKKSDQISEATVAIEEHAEMSEEHEEESAIGASE